MEPLTRLGEQIKKVLTENKDEYKIKKMSYEHDVFEVETSDNQTMTFTSYEYPGLTYGVLVHTEAGYRMTKETMLPLLLAVNDTNKRATDLMMYVDIFEDAGAALVNFKSFSHFDPRVDNTKLIDRLINLHFVEIQKIAVPQLEKRLRELGDFKQGLWHENR